MQARSVIITAGGSGKRMGADLPKQFLKLQNKAILQHSIEAFYAFDPKLQILVTLPEDWHEYWRSYCEENNCFIPHQLLPGGQERFHSIQGALKHAGGNLIAVHDGVRPLIDAETIRNTFEAASSSGAAIPVIPVKESIRKLSETGSVAVLRSEYCLVQTPQIFSAEILKKAYQQEFHDGITDDASLVEALGIDISLVSGNERNIKITSPLDLRIAEILI